MWYCQERKLPFLFLLQFRFQLFILHQVPRIHLRLTLNIQVKRGQRRFTAVTSQNSYSHHNYTLGDERILLRACVSSFTAVCLSVMTQYISPTALSCFQPSHKSLRGADRERTPKRGGWKQKPLWSADTLVAFGRRVRNLKRGIREREEEEVGEK